LALINKSTRKEAWKCRALAHDMEEIDIPAIIGNTSIPMISENDMIYQNHVYAVVFG
jgi:hypothetical protein